MNSNSRKFNIASALIFFIAFAVYFMSAERTGSLWDCGEFILGAYKLQVVHPPGAPLFLIIGRLFSALGDLFSSDPSNIAFAVNLMSGLFSAATAALVGHATMLFSKKMFSSEDEHADTVSAIAGVVAGLSTAFCSSIWFSAVEGEVYAMSTFFTALTAWAVIRWYCLPNETKHDKWLVFAAYSAGLSIGVHLLSLLTFPALALLVYYKKVKNPTLIGTIGSSIAGAAAIPFIQKVVIAGIPSLWKAIDISMVNSFGTPVNAGIIPTLLIVGGIFYAIFNYARKNGRYWLQVATMATVMICIGFSTIGVVVIRAIADTPVNMNVPSDPTRLMPYINREQYGERALLFGPAYDKSATEYDRVPRKGQVNFPPYYKGTDAADYVVVDEKITPKYKSSDKMLFPRIGHSEMGRPNLYKRWHTMTLDGDPKPSFGFNLAFFFKYQINWMYTRYFMWNFVGKQNGSQGYFSWDKSDGNWRSGINFIDEQKLFNLDEEPDTMKHNMANNNYYFLPLIFGLIGLFFHAFKRPTEFAGLFALFLITGIGIILYTNQPPNEPRERDYVLVGSFFTFCIWIGLSVPALYKLVAERFSFKGIPAAAAIGVLVMSAPLIMGFQNFDDHSRNGQYASRDYAKNFLNSLEENAIIFTYGDNDTYPLWYVQEVEDVRRDVRIVNLSLITVDWYINKLRRKVNDSPALKLTVPAASYRGNKRNQLPFVERQPGSSIRLADALKFVGASNPIGDTYKFDSYVPSRNFVIPTDYAAVKRLNMISPGDQVEIAPEIRLTFGENKSWLTKDELAILDVISSNIWERPVYFATTCQNSKLLGLNDYMQYEGLALRVVPIKSTSDKALSIYGSGRVETQKAYDNIMNKWVWGNFDKEKLFVNDSYGAAIQAHRMVMNRLADTLVKGGEPQKAVDIIDKFFEAFPHMNFPYDASVIPMINIYVMSGQKEKAMTHLRILAEETKQHLAFYDSIDPNTVQMSFNQERSRFQNALANIFNLANNLGDDAFKQEMETILGPHRVSNVPN